MFNRPTENAKAVFDKDGNVWWARTVLSLGGIAMSYQMPPRRSLCNPFHLHIGKLQATRQGKSDYLCPAGWFFAPNLTLCLEGIDTPSALLALKDLGV
jgi:hypothetical protein